MSLKLLWTRCSSYAHPKRWRRREEKLPKNSRVVWASCPYSRKRPAASGRAFGDRRGPEATRMADLSKRKILVKWVRSGIGCLRRQEGKGHGGEKTRKAVASQAHRPAKQTSKKEAPMATHVRTLRGPRGAHHRAKRIGQGMGSGHGKTATRGSKGQRSRAGSRLRPGF